jgi:hypothetical protein
MTGRTKRDHIHCPSFEGLEQRLLLDGSILGYVWADTNGNAALDTGEPFLNDWSIELVDAGSGAVVDTRVTGTWDSNSDGSINEEDAGWYRFEAVAAGDYVIREAVLNNWVPTLPATGEYAFSLADGQMAVYLFGNQPGLPRLSGMVFEDTDGDGLLGTDETGLDGVTIDVVDVDTQVTVATGVTGSIDLDGDGSIDPQTESGLYEFELDAAT